ncbi:hypothetical protein B0I37DRAFT_448157 [Chaetomium sp. MPI-CAGE-AT-0009]|nr:hypothetical protein B0I37DRAFT_448157 [Chaetomium sp. MPI-CAGE-AT-0009]
MATVAHHHEPIGIFTMQEEEFIPRKQQTNADTDAHATARRQQQRFLATLNLDPASASLLEGVEGDEAAVMRGVLHNLWELGEMQMVLDVLRGCMEAGEDDGAGDGDSEEEGVSEDEGVNEDEGGSEGGCEGEEDEERLVMDVAVLIEGLWAIQDALSAVQTWREENAKGADKKIDTGSTMGICPGDLNNDDDSTIMACPLEEAKASTRSTKKANGSPKNGALEKVKRMESMSLARN